MNNIWCLRPHNSYGSKIIKKIYNYNQKAISLITCNEDFKKDFDNLKYEKIKKKILINNEILIQNEKLFKKKFKIKKFIKYYKSEKFYKYRFLSIENLSRNERFFGELNFEERNLYTFNQFLYWSDKILTNKPNLIVMFDIPHMYYEMIIIGLASIFNIPVLIIQNNQRSTFFFDKDINPIGNLKNSKSFHEIYKKNILLEKKSNKIKNKIGYLDNVLRLLGLSTINMVSGLIKTIISSHDINSNFIKKNNYNIHLNTIINERYQNIKYLIKCLTNQFKYQQKTKSSLPKKFIFFPLVSNFEADLMPGCSPWTQDTIIKYLLNTLEKDTIICIKEHPRQFKLRFHQQFSRPPNFYENIVKNNRVQLVPLNASTRELIKKSKFIVCSSLSTTAIEGILLKKKIIYFGPDVLPEENATHINKLDYRTNKLKKHNNEKIYYPYKENLKNYKKKFDDYSRYISGENINKIFYNIKEYYKLKNSKKL